jgi:hypothetical protein
MNEAAAVGVGTAPPGSDAAPISPASGRRARWTGWDLVEVAFAVAVFAVMCALILRKAPYLPEPDDYAYQGSIVAMTHGHFLTLSVAQVQVLSHEVTTGPGSRLNPPGMPAIPQWVQLANGRWISEKDPGFPFLAAPFQALGIIRLAQLFYAALACVGLFAGARRWLGRFGGSAAVGLYCSSGAALLFGWREYMPTFTDASLIAAGTGALLWSVLAVESRSLRRVAVGLAGFVALEAATFARYTDFVVLGCALIAVLIAWRLPAVRLRRGALWWWLGSAAMVLVGIGVFNDLVYGGPLRSGYRPGEIRFGLNAIVPNLRYMPAHLLAAMPEFVLGLAALAWIIGRRAWRRPGSTGEEAVAVTRRDLAVGLALAASWFAVWGLYAAYDWTAEPFASTLQVARFYVPALGAISLLGAWLITRLPRRESMPILTALAIVASVAVMFVPGVRAFDDMVAYPFGDLRVVHACGPLPRPGRHGPSGRVRGQPGPAVCPKVPTGPVKTAPRTG